MKNIPVDKIVSIIENLPNPERFPNHIFQVPVIDLRSYLKSPDHPPAEDDVITLVFVKSLDRKNWELEIK